jgi:hypothetical protein
MLAPPPPPPPPLLPLLLDAAADCSSRRSCAILSAVALLLLLLLKATKRLFCTNSPLRADSSAGQHTAGTAGNIKEGQHKAKSSAHTLVSA